MFMQFEILDIVWLRNHTGKDRWRFITWKVAWANFAVTSVSREINTTNYKFIYPSILRAHIASNFILDIIFNLFMLSCTSYIYDPNGLNWFGFHEYITTFTINRSKKEIIVNFNVLYFSAQSINPLIWNKDLILLCFVLKLRDPKNEKRCWLAIKNIEKKKCPMTRILGLTMKVLLIHPNVSLNSIEGQIYHC